MEKFTKISSIATPFPRVNVDTDIIIPAKHLKSIKRTGFGQFAFESVRFDADGNRIEGNVFDGERYKGAQILIAGDNFGCGSSREHAPWLSPTWATAASSHQPSRTSLPATA